MIAKLEKTQRTTLKTQHKMQTKNDKTWHQQKPTGPQSVTCLTADPGVASLMPAQSHTFVEFDHEIISTTILPSADFKGCQLQESIITKYWLTA